MSIEWGLITAAYDLIYPRYDPRAFVGREWLIEAASQFRDNPDGRHLVIVGEPGSGKSAFIAYLAEQWNCPRHFIRADNIGGVLGVDPRVALVSLGSQLYQKYGRDIFDQSGGSTKLSVGWAKDKSEVVGRFVEQMYTLPFLPPRPRDVTVHAAVATGESRVVGEHIAKLVDVTLALDVSTLLQAAVIDPLLKLQKCHPEETVVVLMDALDESPEHQGLRIVDVIPRAADVEFPPNLRLVMTSRPGSHLTAFRKDDLLRLDDTKMGYWQHHQNDVRVFIKRRLDEPPFLEAIALWEPGELASYLRQVEESSEWNYLYLIYYFNEITKDLRKGPVDLRKAAIPEGLDDIYRAFAVEKIRRNPIDRIQLRQAHPFPESFVKGLQEIEGPLHIEASESQVEMIAQSADKVLPQIFSLAAAHQISITGLQTWKGTDLGIWEEKYLPVLGMLALAF